MKLPFYAALDPKKPQISRKFQIFLTIALQSYM